MKKYDIFLFDADNTLFDYDLAEENALKIMFKYCEFNFTENIHLKYREINTQVWNNYEKGEISKDELQIIRFERLFNEINVNYDPIIFNQKYLYELGKGAFLINGALEICKNIKLNNKKIYIVTNGILATQKSRIEHSLIKDYISDYFVSEYVGYNKPSMLYFDYVFSNIPKIDKEKILIIGDSILHDILGGINAGIDNCWFNENGKINETEYKPTYEIKELNEINKFV
jgi:YjjG family noncanonical pyrimidine nucleotidase